MVLSSLWGHPYAMKVQGHHGEREVIMEEHAMSGGVIFSFVLFLFGKLYK